MKNNTILNNLESKFKELSFLIKENKELKSKNYKLERQLILLKSQLNNEKSYFTDWNIRLDIDIIKEVEKTYWTTMTEILSPSRVQHIWAARKKLVYILRSKRYTFSSIGILLNRTHGAVINLYKTYLKTHEHS